MRQKPGPRARSATQVVKDIRRRACKHHSSEEKIRIVMEGLRGEDSIAELSRREGIATSLYYSWSKEFLEACKKRLAGSMAQQATSREAKDLRAGAVTLEETLAEATLENRPLKKYARGWGRRRMRYPASETLEIIRPVEDSHLPIKRTFEKLGVPRSTFHRWYGRYQAFGKAGLEDRKPHPGRVWNRIPDDL